MLDINKINVPAFISNNINTNVKITKLLNVISGLVIVSIIAPFKISITDILYLLVKRQILGIDKSISKNNKPNKIKSGKKYIAKISILVQNVETINKYIPETINFSFIQYKYPVIKSLSDPVSYLCKIRFIQKNTALIAGIKGIKQSIKNGKYVLT